MRTLLLTLFFLCATWSTCARAQSSLDDAASPRGNPDVNTHPAAVSPDHNDIWLSRLSSFDPIVAQDFRLFPQSADPVCSRRAISLPQRQWATFRMLRSCQSGLF